MSHAFCRYDLRTTDLAAARRFYAEVVDLDFTGAPASGEPSMLAAWTLHEQARARGAPPHWLGHIGVTDVEATVRRLLELGSERLGPGVRATGGTEFAILRDPEGAVVAVRAATRTSARGPVAWHQLHARDLDRASTVYADVFGWTRTETLDVADPAGGHRMFAWAAGGQSVGSMANTARTPGIRPHWLFYFSVTDIESAMTKVRAQGGLAPEQAIRLPKGDRIAPCEDGQGAAFGLYQAATTV